MIAIAGPNLPHEVLTAAGCHGGTVSFTPDRPIMRAQKWLESKFSPWAPCVLESWIDGGYDQLDHVLFSRADDTSQRLYYYICELQRRGDIAGPEPLILDIAKIPRESSLQHTADKIRELCGMLDVDDAALENAVCSANAQRAVAEAQSDAPVCLITGSSPPDNRLDSAIIAAGFVPSCQTLAEEWLDLGEAVDEGTGDPVAAIARQVHARTAGPRSFADPSERLAQRIGASGAASVVIWTIEEDEAQTWHLPAEQRKLDQLGIPHLILTRRDWLARDGAADEIGEFLAGLDSTGVNT